MSLTLGTLRTVWHILGFGLEGQVLGLGFGLEGQVLGLGLEGQVLSLGLEGQVLGLGIDLGSVLERAAVISARTQNKTPSLQPSK